MAATVCLHEYDDWKYCNYYIGFSSFLQLFQVRLDLADMFYSLYALPAVQQIALAWEDGKMKNIKNNS